MVAERREAALQDCERIEFRGGVTIVELLVACTLLGVLFGLLLPALQVAREQARNAQCLTNERELGVALHAHYDVRRRLPSGWRRDSTQQTAAGWCWQTLPFLEQRALAGGSELSRQESGRSPADLLQTANLSLPVIRCPSDAAASTFALYREAGEHDSSGQTNVEILATLPHASYLGVFGNSDPDVGSGALGEGPFRESRGCRWEELRRGISNVALLAERTAKKLPATWSGFWLEGADAAGRVTGHAFLGPNRDDADECEFDSRHVEHINVLWGDGRATHVASRIDVFVYRSMARRE